MFLFWIQAQEAFRFDRSLCSDCGPPNQKSQIKNSYSSLTPLSPFLILFPDSMFQPSAPQRLSGEFPFLPIRVYLCESVVNLPVTSSPSKSNQTNSPGCSTAGDSSDSTHPSNNQPRPGRFGSPSAASRRTHSRARLPATSP